MFRWTASGFAFAVCLIEAGVYVNRELRERDLRRFEEAVRCYEQALVIWQETDDRHGEGQALSNLGDAYQELRLSDRAAVFRQDAAAAMRDAGDHDQVARLEQLAPSAQARRHRWRRSG